MRNGAVGHFLRRLRNGDHLPAFSPHSIRNREDSPKCKRDRRHFAVTIYCGSTSLQIPRTVLGGRRNSPAYEAGRRRILGRFLTQAERSFWHFSFGRPSRGYRSGRRDRHSVGQRWFSSWQRVSHRRVDDLSDRNLAGRRLHSNRLGCYRSTV